MISSLLIGALALPCTALTPSTTSTPPAPAFRIQDEVDADKLLKEAGEDLDKVLALADQWTKDGLRSEAKQAFTRALELDADNEIAHKGLRHQFYDGKWFKSYTEKSKYKREEAKLKAEQGFSRLGDEWVLTADIAYISMGWTKTDSGRWTDPHVEAEMQHDKEMAAAGCQLRKEDGSWVHPDDIEKWQQGLWKCGEEWVSIEEANAYHADMEHWWQARTDHFDVLTTCNMDTVLWAQWNAEQTYKDLVRLFGLQPKTRPDVVVFTNIEEFNAFAAGEQGARQAAEASGFSSLHYAYFADAWYDTQSQPPRYLGTGVAYWDAADEQMAAFGKHSVRHAAGLAYVASIAPSYETIGMAVSANAPPDLGAFWAEKPVPRWLFYGGASYVERYYKDGEAENPWWAREWSVQNLRGAGDLDSLETIFAFELSLEAIPASTRLISEAGLVVSFMLDGECQDVRLKHAGYKAALRSGEGTKEATLALQKALIDNKDAFEEYVRGT